MMDYSSSELFKGTAWYYARYRPGYPDELFAHLRKRFGLDGIGRLLDLGCGTGQLALPLAPSSAEVVGMDPEPEMLVEAAEFAEEGSVTNVTWIQGGSGDLRRLSSRLGTFRLAAMGRAFHWMDRAGTLQALSDMIVAGGGIAVVADSGKDSAARREWQDAVRTVIRRWLGEARRAGTATYVEPEERHEEVIARSPFGLMETYTLDYQRVWNLDGIVGHLYSTSFSSVAVLGEKREPFEEDLRTTLLRIEPSGRFTEDVRLQALLAWKA